MPTYDYRCTACDAVFEITRPMGESGGECCPTCGQPGKRIFSPVGVAFKGTGFHNTDYRERPKESAPACAKGEPGGSCAGCPASTS